MEPRPDFVREIVYLLRKLMQASAHYNKQLNKKHNVSASQLATLRALLYDGPMPPSQIARLIMVNSSTVTGVIDRLEKKGLVARLRNDPDRRIIRVELTDEGRALAEKAPPPVQVKIIKGMRKLDVPEREQIMEGLAKLAEMIDAQDLDVETDEEVF